MKKLITSETKVLILESYQNNIPLAVIAREFSVSLATIDNIVNAAGIPRIRSSQCKYDFDLIRSLYEEGKTTREIADEIKGSKSRVSAIIKKIGISRKRTPRISVLESKAKDCAPLDAEFIIALDGLLISDGHLSLPSKNVKTSYYSQSCVFKEWLESISLSFNEFGIENSILEDRRKGILKGYRLYTHRYKQLYKQQQRWYSTKDGEKVIPRDLALTPNFLINWVYGDGTLVGTQLKFCTDSFAEFDVDWLIKELNSKFDIKFRKTFMGKTKSGKDKWRPSICKRDGLIEFYNILGLPKFECFRYKWPKQLL